MPNVISIISPYLVNGNPDTLNVAGPTKLVGSGAYPPGSFFPYAPGDLGSSFDYNDKRYALVVCDSGATAATAVGVVAANQVAFWKSQSQRIVTNDFTQAITPGSPEFCGAGIFRNAVTAGNYCCILTKGYNLTVAAGTTAVGPASIDATSGKAEIVTAVSTKPVVAYCRVAASAGSCTADVDFGFLQIA
jgi:hypothetical protein